MIFKNEFYKLISLVTIFVISFFLASQADAASLYLTSSNSKVTVGSLVTVNLLVNTQGKTINNAEATLQFSNDLIDVISVKGSLFSLWVESPSFSNSSGRISFNGGIPDPGYNGGGAKVLTIVAKAKKAGTASFLFGDAAVRENDGLGTDILTGQSPTSFSIISSTPSTPNVSNIEEVKNKAQVNTNTPVTPNPSASEIDIPIVISSPTYSNSDAWYSSGNGLVKWNLPSKATAVQTLLDNNQYSTPTIKYSPVILSKNIGELSDGVWYFHVRYLLNNSWSKTSHLKIQIDKTVPINFSITPEKSGNCINGLRLAASDNASGIDYYNVSIDNQPDIKVLASDAQNIIPWSQPKPGIHHILATVYDKAGNKSELSTEINVEKLETPVLNNIESEIFVGKKITISGESLYTNSPIKIIINSVLGAYKDFSVVSDESGKFSLDVDIPETGSYQILVYASGCNEENDSLPVQAGLTVKPSIDSSKSVNYFNINYSALFNILKIALVLILLFGWYKYIMIKVRVLSTKKKIKRLSITSLLEKADKELLVLERARKKKNLTRSEEKALISLKKIISDIDDLNKAKK